MSSSLATSLISLYFSGNHLILIAFVCLIVYMMRRKDIYSLTHSLTHHDHQTSRSIAICNTLCSHYKQYYPMCHASGCNCFWSTPASRRHCLTRRLRIFIPVIIIIMNTFSNHEMLRSLVLQNIIQVVASNGEIKLQFDRTIVAKPTGGAGMQTFS